MPASMIARLDDAPLTAGILLGLGLIGSASASTPAPQANTIVVQNCNDNGSGSLRAAVAAAASGDIIDLTQLACTRITLTTGQITVPLTSLTLNGPGPDQLNIDGNSGGNHYGPFAHLQILAHRGSQFGEWIVRSQHQQCCSYVFRQRGTRPAIRSGEPHYR